MSKYIKRVNWPWVEIEDNYDPSETITINTDDISVVWPHPNGRYHYGVYIKDVGWIESQLSVDALKELQELLMNRKVVKTKIPLPGALAIDTELEMMHENQILYEWLEENGQA